MRFPTEQAVQDWLEATIQSGGLHQAIRGADDIDAALADWESAEMWPTFPIDYLSRLWNLRAARQVQASLHSLDLVSKNNKNISQTKGERLFTDLLYCARHSSQFVIVEIKNQDASARETVTELLAYEHEVLNHLPFAGSSDLLMVVVSRAYSTLLDHAITGLNTWSRRRILCLRFDDSGESPCLHVHVPKAWAAIGQKTLAADGVVTAALTFAPDTDLTEEQVYALCDTAAALMVREAERAGGSGFAIVAYNHLFPGMATAPYLILAGVVNPFSFMDQAKQNGFLDLGESPVAKYVLGGGTLGDLSASWDWLSCDGGAAVEYLEGFGSATWESFSDWQSIRDVERWRVEGLTLDRHITPVSMDFWGVLGDYARDAVRRIDRLRNFMPGLAKPGLDWRHPALGVALLDEVSVEPLVAGGQWTFSAIFGLGLRLGRLCAFAAQFADANEEARRLLQGSLFWAEADLQSVLHEVAVRYLSAAEITEEPPRLTIGKYESGAAVGASFSAFAQWFSDAFIGPDLKFMVDAFATGLHIHAVFDPQFDAHGDDPTVAELRAEAETKARDWLKWSVVAALDTGRDSKAAAEAIGDAFGDELPLAKGKQAAFEAIDALGGDVLIGQLFETIPKIVDCWHPQLAHTLAPLSTDTRDWAWYEEQIREARARGEKYPCIVVSAGGQVGIGRLPPDGWAPHVADPEKQVLLVTNESVAEITLVVTWADLRAGNVPGFS